MPGDFDFDDDLDAPRRRVADRDERPARRTGPAVSPVLILGLTGGGVVFLIAVVVAILVVRKAIRDAEPAADQRPVAQAVPPVAAAPRGPANPPRKDPEPDPRSPNKAMVDRVKSATVRVRVLFRNGQAGSGTGFVERSSNKVLTNAHVLGLIEKKGEPRLGGPRLIELVVNSGEPGKEYSLGGELLAADTDTDLALLRPYSLDDARPYLIPEGLVVPRTSKLDLLDPVLVFGYPFGEQLGTEITVSETSVSSLRKDPATGRLSLIQVKGGMNPGNSGGPVVDARGNVVGVAQAGIKGTDINFAIPGEVVHEFLARKR